MPAHPLLAVILLALAATSSASAADPAANLLPNGNFTGADPFRGWIRDFPDEAHYRGNAPYLKMAEAGGRRALMLDLPAGIAGNQGGKIESVPVPVEPGASYRIEVDCMTWDFSARIHAEAWTTDPEPGQKRTIFRRAPRDGRPALIMCYRAQVPSPPSASKVWTTAGRDFTVPATVVVAGRKQAPEFISVKVVAYHGTMNAGKSYFSNFRLTRRDAPGTSKPPPTAPKRPPQ
ncbi:MAG: hypothetical protein MUF04_03055 [Akkermansiaceae bacterium]|jgi:hypothetical protein|nr:hypothetical protein [Akkermansiaceae bacterium]